MSHFSTARTMFRRNENNHAEITTLNAINVHSGIDYDLLSLQHSFVADRVNKFNVHDSATTPPQHAPPPYGGHSLRY